MRNVQSATSRPRDAANLGLLGRLLLLLRLLRGLLLLLLLHDGQSKHESVDGCSTSRVRGARRDQDTTWF
mgnify:CR=1 FL=1